MGRLTFLVVLLVVVAAACGDDDEVGGVVPPATDDVVADDVSPSPTLDPELVESEASMTGPGGEEIVVQVDCDPPIGGQLLSLSLDGFVAGSIVAAEVQPDVGELRVAIGPAGSGAQAVQTTLDAERYDVTVPVEDGAVDLTVDGCSP